jgi:hypothetical protein
MQLLRSPSPCARSLSSPSPYIPLLTISLTTSLITSLPCSGAQVTIPVCPKPPISLTISLDAVAISLDGALSKVSDDSLWDLSPGGLGKYEQVCTPAWHTVQYIEPIIKQYIHHVQSLR